MKVYLGILVAIMGIGLAVGSCNQSNEKQVNLDIGMCKNASQVVAEDYARQTGKYKLAVELEQAFFDVCMDDTDSTKRLYSFLGDDADILKKNHLERLETLLLKGAIANAR